MSVDLLLSGLRWKLPLGGTTNLDTPVCKLHYKFTTNVLLTFCILITATNLIGDRMLCTFSEHPQLKDDVVNSFCWVQSTYTVKNMFHKNAIHPGVGAFHQKTDEKVYHSYYQWVPFLLFLQGLMFYAPHWVWQSWEGGKVAAVSEELQGFIMKKDDRRDKIQLVAEYLQNSINSHNTYAFKYLFCEMLYFLNTIFNMWILNVFLNGNFISYGTRFFSFDHNDDEESLHPKLILFPRMTKCDFKTIGPSGTPQNLDILCLLPHSIINEKVYLFLWLWLWVLLIVTVVALLYRFVVFFVPVVRNRLLLNYVGERNKNDVTTLSKKLGLGDYFLLYLLQKNISSLAFQDLVKDLSVRIANKPTNSLEMCEKGNGAGRAYALFNEPR